MGKFIVPELPPHLAQGMFKRPGSYDVIMRYSSLTPKLVPDNVSAPRGIGMKIFGVWGEKIWVGQLFFEEASCISNALLGRGQENTGLDLQQLPSSRTPRSTDHIRDCGFAREELERFAKIRRGAVEARGC
jgi:hypothetical protein